MTQFWTLTWKQAIQQAVPQGMSIIHCNKSFITLRSLLVGLHSKDRQNSSGKHYISETATVTKDWHKCDLSITCWHLGWISLDSLQYICSYFSVHKKKFLVHGGLPIYIYNETEQVNIKIVKWNKWHLKVNFISVGQDHNQICPKWDMNLYSIWHPVSEQRQGDRP